MRVGVRTKSPVVSAEESVFVIDDDPLVRDSLSSLLRSVGLRVEVFESATELLQYQLPDAPSCLVSDIRLPQVSGLDLQAELRASGVMIPIIFITAHGDIPMSVRAMKAGAIDFLPKPFRDQEIIDAVTGALARDRKRRKEEKSNSDVHVRFASLTPRQRQVMALVTGGLLNKQIAAKMGISEMTVKIHRAHVMRKMGTRSLADLVMIAEHLGIRGQTDSSAST
jgi:FixJ family two-component response regulator